MSELGVCASLISMIRNVPYTHVSYTLYVIHRILVAASYFHFVWFGALCFGEIRIYFVIQWKMESITKYEFLMLLNPRNKSQKHKPMQFDLFKKRLKRVALCWPLLQSDCRMKYLNKQWFAQSTNFWQHKHYWTQLFSSAQS